MKLVSVVDCLDAIEAELRSLERWAEQPPEVSALESSTPFCVDTLAFEEWLQWILLPRMRALLDAGAELPSQSAIAEMAEVVFAENLGRTAGLRRALKQLDRLLVRGA